MKPEALFERYLRQELSSEETASLKDLLRNDPDAGREFARFVHETSLLLRVGSQLSFPESKGTADRILPARRHLKPQFYWAIAACLVGLGFLLSLKLQPAPDLPGISLVAVGTGVQVISSSQNTFKTNWIDTSALPVVVHPGDRIQTGPRGTASLRYPGESTQIELGADSLVEMADALHGKKILLRTGQLQAKVAPQPRNRPFLFTTPTARATIIGTEFLLTADAKVTQLDVFSGKVQFTCSFNSKKVLVSSGFSSVSDSTGPSPAVPFSNAPPSPASNRLIPAK